MATTQNYITQAAGDARYLRFNGTNGTATIPSGSTSVVVTHGLSTTPNPQDLHVVPTNNPTNDPGNIWLSAVGATTFTINVRANPGAGGATFSWKAIG